jgi:uncharacterized protein (UPF0210 family)
LIGRQVAQALDVPFGIVDLSLAPTPRIGDSVGEILKILGVDEIGAPGSTAIVALLNDAVKKGGSFASQSVGGLSGAFIPVCEDRELAEAVRRESLGLEKLEAMTSVCSVGLDMIAIPGSVDAATIAAIIADEMVIGTVNNKTTAVRLIPAPGKEAGEMVSFGGLFGESAILPVRHVGKSARYIRAGRIAYHPGMLGLHACLADDAVVGGHILFRHNDHLPEVALYPRPFDLEPLFGDISLGQEDKVVPG